MLFAVVLIWTSLTVPMVSQANETAPLSLESFLLPPANPKNTTSTIPSFSHLIAQLAENEDNELKTTDQLLDEMARESNEQNEADKERTDDLDIRSKHLLALNKPITEISLIQDQSTKTSPRNVAITVLPSKTDWVTSLGIPTPRPERYTVGFSHQPLYFEQAKLERCGLHLGCLQNAVSASMFLTRVKWLPYHLGKKPTCQCFPTKGDCQSCERFPIFQDVLPLDSRGAILQAAAIAGFVILVQ